MTRRSLFAFSLAPFFRKFWRMKQPQATLTPPLSFRINPNLSPEEFRANILPVITHELETGVRGTLKSWERMIKSSRAYGDAMLAASAATGITKEQIAAFKKLALS